jgi:hypothetical protein
MKSGHSESDGDIEMHEYVAALRLLGIHKCSAGIDIRLDVTVDRLPD